MSRAHHVAEAIARNIDIRKVAIVSKTIKELYGYTSFVVDQVALRRFLQANWKFMAASLDDQIDAFNYAYDIVESRIEAVQA